MNDNAVDILLVEDRAEDAELTMMALEQHHISNKIIWVKDGQEALDYLFCKGQYADRVETAIPKLVLLDLNMPKVGGIDVLKAIRNNPVTKKMTVVILTTSKEEYDISSAYEIGVNSYIVKPVQFSDFTETVKNLGMYWLLLNQHPTKH